MKFKVGDVIIYTGPEKKCKGIIGTIIEYFKDFSGIWIGTIKLDKPIIHPNLGFKTSILHFRTSSMSLLEDKRI